MTDPDPIEIKVNIGGNVEPALTALGLGEGKARKVWFLDDLTEGLEKPLPLLTEDIILRLRRRDNGKEDSTIKLRPCRRSQLAGKWAAAPPDDEQYRIEGDWSRSRHVLAASCVADLQRGTIENALDGPGRIADLFSDPQREFLADCGQIRVALGAVTVLGAGRSPPPSGKTSPSAVSPTLSRNAGQSTNWTFWNCRSGSSPAPRTPPPRSAHCRTRWPAGDWNSPTTTCPRPSG